jgi:hypothetical protein
MYSLCILATGFIMGFVAAVLLIISGE